MAESILPQFGSSAKSAVFTSGEFAIDIAIFLLSFTDDEFLQVMNLICKSDVPFGEEYKPLVSMDDRIDLGRLDSLGMMVFFVWLSRCFVR